MFAALLKPGLVQSCLVSKRGVSDQSLILSCDSSSSRSSAEVMISTAASLLYLTVILQLLSSAVVPLALHAANWCVYDYSTSHKVFHIRHARTRHIY